MKGVVTWASRHATAALLFTLGVAMGVAIKYPTGWYLSDGVLSMVAALVGAAATAGAVFIGFNLQREQEGLREAQAQRDLRSRILRHLWPFFVATQIHLQGAAGAEERNHSADELARTARRVAKELQESRLFTERLDISGLEIMQLVVNRIEAVAITAEIAAARAADKADSSDPEWISLLEETRSAARQVLKHLVELTSNDEAGNLERLLQPNSGPSTAPRP